MTWPPIVLPRLAKPKSPDIIHVLEDLPKGPLAVQRLKLFDLVHGDG